MLKLPIEFQDENCRCIHKALLDDLEIITGNNPLYKCVFNPKHDIEKRLFARLSRYHSNSPQYITDTQVYVSQAPEQPIKSSITAEVSEILEEAINSCSGFKEKYGYPVWKHVQWINESHSTLGFLFGYKFGAPLLSLLVPIICLIVPLVLILYRRSELSLSNYVVNLHHILKSHTLGGLFEYSTLTFDKKLVLVGTIIFYFFQTYMNVQDSIVNYKNSSTISAKISLLKNYVPTTITNIENVQAACTGLPTYQGFSRELENLKNSLHELNSKLSLCEENSIKCIGHKMLAWYQVNCDPQIRDTLSKSVDINVFISNLSSVAKQVRDGTLSKAIMSETTRLSGLRYLQINSPLPFSVSLKNGLVLTGPNSSGKTTVLKAVLVACLLSQQIGHAPCKKCRIRPYTHFHSYLNIADTCDKDSVFEREARKCKDVLELLEEPGSNHLGIFDELFSGTNPADASEAGSRYLNHVAGAGNLDFLVTTHLTQLCEQLKENKIKNLHMEVICRDSEYLPTYKIKKGISYVRGANQVLKDMQFPDEIAPRA